MKRGLIILAVLTALGTSVSAAPTGEEVFKAIVKIRATVPPEAQTARTLGTERQGNGIVIDSQGHVLTIGYLIVEAEKIEVLGPEGKSTAATFVGYDHQTGFGLLRLETPIGVPPLETGNSAEIKEGDPLLVAGYGGQEAAQGVRVISRREFAGYWEYLLENPIITAPPHPNFAGAALIGRDGRLLGVGSLFTQVLIPGLGLIPSNVFVPIDLLKPILSDLIASGRPREAPRPWLGLNADEAHGRVFVTQVTAGGPAERAGLKPGDLILQVKETPVKGLADFYRRVWALGSSGVEVPLRILQGSEIRDLKVHSSDRHQFLRLKPKKLI